MAFDNWPCDVAKRSVFYYGSQHHILRAADLLGDLSSAVADVPQAHDLRVSFVIHRSSFSSEMSAIHVPKR